MKDFVISLNSTKLTSKQPFLSLKVSPVFILIPRRVFVFETMIRISDDSNLWWPKLSHLQHWQGPNWQWESTWKWIVTSTWSISCWDSIPLPTSFSSNLTEWTPSSLSCCFLVVSGCSLFIYTIEAHLHWAQHPLKNYRLLMKGHERNTSMSIERNVFAYN